MRPGACRAPLHEMRAHPADAARAPLRALAEVLDLRVQADPRLPAHAAVIGEGAPPDAPAREGGYALRIAPDGILLRGHDARGLVWGLQTLRQILDQAPRPPCLDIRDGPEYRVRYHHDDISRKQVSTVEDFRRIVRHLASFKVSHYTLYIEDMLQVDGVPLMGAGRGALSPADVRAIVAEGARWQVDIFPTLSLAGHQENLLRYPRYRPLGAATWQPPSSFDPSRPGVREHLRRVIDAACAVFPSPFFHMGFDEVIGLDAEAFVEHLTWCARQLVARGRTPLYWADMLYNHFGCGLVKRLPTEAIPVVWGYGPRRLAKFPGGTSPWDALAKFRRLRPDAWVLAGYCNWGSFLHAPFDEVHRQWRDWRKAADPAQVTGFGASQWGDDGYENSRDLGWPLFAAFAEQAWSGAAADPSTVEERFHAVFHGHPLPDLAALRRDLSAGLAIAPREAWRLHRLPAPGWARLARIRKLPSESALRRDARRLADARRALERARDLALREKGHLDHLGVAIDRLAAVNARAQAARRPAAIPAAIAALRRARRAYRAGWLAHNRPENIEVSLAVFDRQMESWQTERRPPSRPPAGWHPLDLGRLWNVNSPAVAGVPRGLAVIDGVPFRFAGVNRTHGRLAPGESARIALPGVPIRDLHLAATMPRRGETPRPALRLRLTRRGRLVYEEDLLSIRHLCDWWAPLGEHIWAGGGLAYVDPMRVRYLLSPNPPHGIACVWRFPWPVAPVADHLELMALGPAEVQIFAITVEEAAR
jgi:hypothetical protein